MTEEGRFQARVKKWLEEHDLYDLKQNASALSKTGAPDRVLCLLGIFVGIELKKNDEEEATPLQQYNINKINNKGGIAFVLRPTTFKKFKEITLDFLRHENVEKYREDVKIYMEVK